MSCPLCRASTKDDMAHAPREVVVWDPLVRLFHWTVVAGCVIDLFIIDDGKYAHRIIGYLVAFALAARVVWGFIGSPHARFADFVPRPRAFTRYVAALVRGQEPRFIGHNPAGAVIMLMLMVLLAGVSVTGWMLTLDANFGNDTLEELHGALANAILILGLLHAAAALYEGRRHGENLVLAMITGRKRA
jgi:cytochrome b